MLRTVCIISTRRDNGFVYLAQRMNTAANGRVEVFVSNISCHIPITDNKCVNRKTARNGFVPSEIVGIFFSIFLTFHANNAPMYSLFKTNEL